MAASSGESFRETARLADALEPGGAPARWAWMEPAKETWSAASETARALLVCRENIGMIIGDHRG